MENSFDKYKLQKSISNVDYVMLLESALTEAGKLGEYYSYFHDYSFRNQLLLRMQGVKSPVATFKKWKEMGRIVKKGSISKQILIPVKHDTKLSDDDSEETKSISWTSYIPKNCLFELNDTDGELYYYPSCPLPNFDKTKILSAFGIEEKAWQEINGNIQGVTYTQEKMISINPIAVYPSKTFLHEVAHCLLHSDKVISHDLELPQELKEVEAESVAYIVGTYLGILDEESKSYSRGYIQNWIKDDKLQEKNANRIFGAVDKILKALSI